MFAAAVFESLAHRDASLEPLGRVTATLSQADRQGTDDGHCDPCDHYSQHLATETNVTNAKCAQPPGCCDIEQCQWRDGGGGVVGKSPCLDQEARRHESE